MMRRRAIVLWVLLGLILAGYLVCLPRDLFRGVPYSTVVTDRNGELLGARIASDGQWRFPPCDTVPDRYATALVAFEDHYFYYHPGVNPVALVRAFIGNLQAGHVTSGGSTVTMQVIRMSRQRERTLWQKLVEGVLATRLELRYPKKHILALYASHAPFGGNVVGIDAAAWRYFGRPPGELSWSEVATLAVLPNAPSSIHPGKGQEALLKKRNRLLERLRDKGKIDALTCELACDEPLPQAPLPLPSLASHYVERQPKGVETRTTLDYHLQKKVEEVAARWSDDLAIDGVADLAAVVIDLKTNEIIAYVGNASPERNRPGLEVDIAHSPRSTGSILKPILYCGTLQDGMLLPRTLLPDTPLNIGGFTPQNFDRTFQGAVPANEALARSLNVPAVHLLRRYGVPRFRTLLQECGMSTLPFEATHYGLSLILGGAEGTLEDITRMYAGMVRSYEGLQKDFPLHDRAALWYTFEALSEVNRPDEIDWKLISSVRRIAWKTGTSYGFRDAWSVGVTPDYAVGVWCGNAQGQGVPGLTGAKTAGPVLFDLFGLLPATSHWFDEPAEGVYAQVCTVSGHLRNPTCPTYETMLLPARAMESDACPYHRDGVFVLPPAMEWYYKPRHPEYVVPGRTDTVQMEFIYPESGSVLSLPRQLDGSEGSAVFQLAHRRSDAVVYWHLDNQFIGETHLIHQKRLSPPPGRHVVTVVDDRGETAAVRFSIE